VVASQEDSREGFLLAEVAYACPDILRVLKRLERASSATRVLGTASE
jgi:hypothetical protein